MRRTGSMAVTGASGMLGRHFCAFFHAKGWEVRALVRDPAACPLNLEGLRIHRFELPDRIEEQSLAGVRVLVHCAATTRSEEIAAARRVDEEGAHRLLAVARAAGVERVVFPSSTSARADAPSNYGRSKHAIEGMLDPERDLSFRLGLVLSKGGGGLFQRLVEGIARTRLVPVFGGGRQRVQPIHVEDVCRALESALAKNLTGTLVVADPEGIPFRRLLREIARRLDRRVALVPVPYAPVLWLLRRIESLHIPFPVTSENLQGLQAHRFVPSAADLARLGLRVRSTGQGLDDVLGSAPGD